MPEAGSGTLVLVVGPSGAGKDTLIAAARRHLAGDARFAFVRRTVTRPAVPALEDHESLDSAGFAAAERTGAFALCWSAHGHRYGLPATLDGELARGRIVVANVSRAAVTAALARYGSARIILVTASAAVRARRLAARGRESEAQIAARLAREGAAVPEGAAVTVVDNSGALDDGTAAFVTALARFARD